MMMVDKWNSRRILWATQLRSCLLCMTSLNKANFNRVYCGLSDGNLAIVQVSSRIESIENDPSPLVIQPR